MRTRNGSRLLVGGAALMLALSACKVGPIGSDDSGDKGGETSVRGGTGDGGSESGGSTAKSASTAFPVEARDVRLVRSGDQELALQFDFHNGGTDPIAAESLIDKRQQLLALVDLPRATGYGLLGTSTSDGRMSDSAEEDVEPGKSVTVTAMFAAPPKDTTRMLVALDGLLPIEVPVQPAGSPALKQDPVLQGEREELRVAPLICKVGGGSKGKPGPSQFRLPSDVLFAFGSADLTPAARTAISELGEKVDATAGTVTVEGHTDSIGDDASNQGLSERRAAAVRDALKAKLGSSFTYKATGFGETRPVAPNTKNGKDNPDGRAQNRRVEIKVQTPGSAPPAELAPAGGGTDLAGSGLKLSVDGVEQLDGLILARVKVDNPTGGTLKLGFTNHFTPKEVTTGQLTLADKSGGRRHEACAFTPPRYFDFMGTLSSTFSPNTQDDIPAGATVTLWSLFAGTVGNASSVDVEVAGFGQGQQAEIKK